MKKNKGAISIFFIIITIPSLIFAGLFIDASRVLVAEIKVRNALNSAVRSSLSYYDENLVSEYGLYGISREAVEENYLRYLRINLEQKTNSFQLIKYEIDAENTGIEVREPLISSKNLKGQIAEYMKYKAPVYITGGIIEKFKDAFAMKRMTAIKSADNAANAFDEFKGAVNNINMDKIKSAFENGLKSKFSDKIEKIKNEEATTDDISELIDNTREIINEGIRTSTIALEQYGNYKEASKDADQAIADACGEPSNDTQTEAASKNISELVSQLNDAKEKLESISDPLKTHANTIYVLRQANLDLDPDDPEDAEKIAENEEDIDESIEEMEKVAEELGEAQVKAEVGKINVSSENVAESDEEKNNKIELKAALSKLNDALEAITADISDYQINGSPEGMDLQETDVNTEKLNRMSWKMAKELLDSIQNVIENSADNIYITEYIMDKCTFLTSQVDRARFFKRGEVEYIITGNPNQIEAITATIGYVATIRFVINAMDYFIYTPNPEILTRIGIAVVRGLGQTAADMFNLIFTADGSRSASIGVTPQMQSVRVTYSDHLRLLLLMKMNDSKLNGLDDTLQAALSTIKKNESEEDDFLLDQLYTSVHAKVRVKMNLLFLPMIGEKLNLPGFEGDSYIITRETDARY